MVPGAIRSRRLAYPRDRGDVAPWQCRHLRMGMVRLRHRRADATVHRGMADARGRDRGMIRPRRSRPVGPLIRAKYLGALGKAAAPKPRRKMRRVEQAFQQRVAYILDLVRTPAWLWWHVPNGGWRSKVEAGILKSMGLKAGVHDVHILFAGRRRGGGRGAPGGAGGPGRGAGAGGGRAAGGRC